ncbi:hypothetical protein M0R04_07505 [Candidatus Dojkabacteria bacterium]|jgi:hypothetical protein|nr:hypothetical protein [Candidatus Dojkabacteria bacterium]
MQNPEYVLDEAVVSILQSLRELESDNDETTNSMEQNIEYIITESLKQIYTSTVDQRVALGLLEAVKMAWFLTHFSNQ